MTKNYETGANSATDQNNAWDVIANGTYQIPETSKPASETAKQLDEDQTAEAPKDNSEIEPTSLAE